MSHLQYIISHPRLDEFKRNKKLKDGLHYEVFNINQFEYYKDPKNQYIAYNYPSILTNTFGNLIWSEEPSISFENEKNQKYIEEALINEGFFLTMRQGSETASFAGDAVFKIHTQKVYGDEYQPVVSLVDNSMWYPIYDSNNTNLPAKGHILVNKKKINDDKDTAILLEIHTSGKIEWESYVVKDGEGYDEAKEVSPLNHFKEELEAVLVQQDKANSSGKLEYLTGCKYPLVFQMSNVKCAGEFFGTSDYTVPVIAKVYAINQNYNQIQYVLKKHAHPKMNVPKDVIKQAIAQVTSNDEQAQNMGWDNSATASKLYRGDKSLFETLVAQKIINKVEFFGTDVNSGEPKYLTWDGNLVESREQIQNLKNALYDETQVAKVLLDPEIATGNLSGVAIQRLAQPSLHSAIAKKAYIKETMRKMLYTVLELAKHAGLKDAEVLEAEHPAVQFRDGLVNDLKEVIEQQQMLLDGGLTTKIDAIMNTQDLTEESAKAKYDEIMNENNMFGGDMQITQSVTQDNR